MIPKPNRALRWAVGGLCAAWLVGVMCAVHISTWPAPPALMVFGADRVWRGATAGFRAVVRDSASRVPLTHLRLEAWLEDTHQQSPHARAEVDDAAAWTLNVPAFEGDAAWLVVRDVTGDATAMQTETRVPLHVVNQPREDPLTLSPLGRHAPVVNKRAPGLDMALVPDGGHFAVGLANPGIGLVQRDTRPAPGVRVRCASLHVDTLTDVDGLFDFTYTPPLHPEPLRFVVGEEPAPAWLEVLPRAQVTQFQMLVPTRCFAQPEPLPLHIDALPLRDPLAVDLWLNDLLLGTTALRVQQRSFDVSLAIKAALPSGFLTVVAFRHVLNPAAACAATRPMGSGADNPLAALLARNTDDPWLRAHTRTPSTRAARFALARVQAGHGVTPLMYDDTEAVWTAFEQRRHAIRRLIYQVMGGLMGLSLAVIAMAVWQMRRRLRQDVSDVLQTVPQQTRVDEDAARQMTRVTHRMYLVLAILALVLACYGLLAVVTSLRWQ